MHVERVEGVGSSPTQGCLKLMSPHGLDNSHHNRPHSHHSYTTSSYAQHHTGIYNVSDQLGVWSRRMWLSIIWNSSGGCGIRPVSSLDQTGTSLNLISKAPVETNCPSIALVRKKIIRQPYILLLDNQFQNAGVGWPIFSNILMPAATQITTKILTIPNIWAKWCLHWGGG